MASVSQLVRHIGNRVRRFRTAGSNLLFPPRCAACGADLPQCVDDLHLCPDCQLTLGPPLWPCCPRCGAAVTAAAETSPGCDLCRRPPLKVDTVVVLGGYRAELRDVVLRMKRPSQETLSAAMGRLLATRRGEQLSALKPDLVVPIPMFWARRLNRATNSPEIVAAVLGRSLWLPVHRRVLSRRRNTPPQAGLSPRERFRNVRGAFRVRKGSSLQGARVLLVDDILTTGATCSEAAGMLKRAGAALVAAAVIARAQGPNST